VPPPTTRTVGTEQDLGDDRALVTSRVIEASPDQEYAASVSAERLALVEAEWLSQHLPGTRAPTRRDLAVRDERPERGEPPVIYSLFEALLPGRGVVIRHLSVPRSSLIGALVGGGRWGSPHLAPDVRLSVGA